MKAKIGHSKRAVGLDVHPDTFTAAILVGNHPRTAGVEQLTDQIPLDQLESWLKKNCRKDDVIVMEASGNSFGVFYRANDIGYSIIILESKQVAKYCDEGWANDRSSATLVAKVFLSGMIRDDVWVPDPITRQRREILGSYQESVKDTTRIVNRLRSFLNEHTIRLPRNMKLTSVKARGNVLRRKNWSGGETLILNQAFDDLSRAQSKQKAMLRHMALDIASDRNLLNLMRIFGVGVVTSYALMAMIGTVERFPSAKKLVAYLGLNPQRKESGLSDKPVKKKRKGNKEVRALLVECAHTAFRHGDSAFHKWACRLAFRKGCTFQGNHKDTRGKKIAAVAVARKIVTAVWYYLKGRPFKVVDAPKNLVGKLRKLCAHIGKERVREDGYKTYKELVTKLLENMQEEACNPT